MKKIGTRSRNRRRRAGRSLLSFCTRGNSKQIRKLSRPPGDAAFFHSRELCDGNSLLSDAAVSVASAQAAITHPPQHTGTRS